MVMHGDTRKLDPRNVRCRYIFVRLIFVVGLPHKYILATSISQVLMKRVAEEKMLKKYCDQISSNTLQFYVYIVNQLNVVFVYETVINKKQEQDKARP